MRVVDYRLFILVIDLLSYYSPGGYGVLGLFKKLLPYFSPPTPLRGRLLRNCPVGNFREVPGCRDGFIGDINKPPLGGRG